MTFPTDQANYRKIDRETYQAIVEKLNIDQFLVAMRLRNQVYQQESSKKITQRGIDFVGLKSEEFFWKLHSLPEDRWTRHSTVLFDEELQYEGAIYVKHCD